MGQRTSLLSSSSLPLMSTPANRLFFTQVGRLSFLYFLDGSLFFFFSSIPASLSLFVTQHSSQVADSIDLLPTSFVSLPRPLTPNIS